MSTMSSMQLAEHIKKETATLKRAWVDALGLQQQARHMVGSAQVYISHAWSCNALDLFEAIFDMTTRNHEALGDDPVIWLDILSFSQHTQDNVDRSRWVDLLFSAIGSQRRVALVLSASAADNGSIPAVVKRLWCVMEVLACIVQRGRVFLAFPPAQRQRFLAAVKANPAHIRQLFGHLRSTDCQCTFGEDKTAIVSVLQKRGIELLRVDRGVRGALEAAACLELRQEAEGASDALERERLRTALGVALMETGRGQEAVVELEAAVRGLREAVGTDNAETVAAMTSLGVAYSKVGRHVDVRRVCEQGLEARKRLYGEQDRETLRARSNLAQAYSNLKLHDKALAQHEAGLAARRSVLGEEHEETLASLHNTGVAQHNVGDLAAAEASFRECAERRRAVLGAAHADTAMTLSWMGMVLFKQERYSEAERVFSEEVQVRKRTGGAAHPLTVAAERNLAAAFRKQRPTR